MDQATKPMNAVSPLPEGDSAPAADLTGKTIADYRLLRRLGQGGMGQVYLAEQISLKRNVAVKILKPDLAANKTALARFKKEAEAVAKATHANIVQVYAFHEIGGHHLMALEYVEGRNLREFLERKGPPEILLGLSIMRQVAAALQRASELGIVHRDIKPENILLTRKGEVKVADFGLSRELYNAEAPTVNLTQSHVTMGTPLYMSPEQVEGKKTIDHRSDIYSFGITCYHMFAGHPPFRGTVPFEVAVQHVQAEPQPLTEIRPDLPPALCAMIHKMIAKAPEDRYQTGKDVVRDIATLRDSLVSAAQAVAPTIPMEVHDQRATPVGISTLAIPRGVPSLWPRRLLYAALILAFPAGLAASWYMNQPREKAYVPTVPVIAETKPVKVDNRSVEEKELLALIQKHDMNSKSQLELVTGLNYSMKLGLIYLKDRNRLDEADKYFKEMLKSPLQQYKMLSRLGTAMVLAFKDQPDQSLKVFMNVLGKKDTEKGIGPWYNNPPFREMVAKALNFNLENLKDRPTAFPDHLRPLLQAPAPTVKMP